VEDASKKHNLNERTIHIIYGTPNITYEREKEINKLELE
jgi:hypothetical protein